MKREAISEIVRMTKQSYLEQYQTKHDEIQCGKVGTGEINNQKKGPLCHAPNANIY